MMRAIVLAFIVAAAATARADEAAEIARFNHALDQATRTMSNAATLALWEDDGVSLLPNRAPIVGKKAIGKLLDDVTAKMPNAKMTTFELDCHDLRVDGRGASEWCNEHQIVQVGAGKPPFDGRGKMLLVLHKGDDGRWRLSKEMWNP
jgi:ketosteroid isomerase-like protein